MDDEILDDFHDEQPNLPTQHLLHRVNMAMGTLIILIGLFFIYNCYYWYNIENTSLIPIQYYVSNYELLSWLSFGVMLLHGGFRIHRKEKSGIKTIHVAAIAIITYSVIIICFENPYRIVNLYVMGLYLLLALSLLVFSNWKKLPYLYPNLSIPSYLWIVGVIIGIIPFLFYYDELGF